MKRVKFDIQGMTCSSCSTHVERAVKKLGGINNVNVNLLSNNMIVEYDEEKTNNETIIKSVIDAGYGASLSNNEKVAKKSKNNNELKSMKKRLIISIICLIPLMYMSMSNKFFVLQILLLIPIIILNRNYFLVGFKRLFKRSPNMDSLIAIGSTAAILYGFFESAGMILTLITLGKYLETKSKEKTSDAISKLINLAPKTAIVFRDNKEIEVSVGEIVKDDILLVKPGSSIPVDGVIIEGNSYIDQAAITGESVPVEKGVGDNVISGTINKNGALKIKATKVGEDTTLSQIIKLVEEASNSKAPISRLADKVSGIFVPVVITIAILATIFWLISGQSLEFALSTGIAVLVISCPCALGLATPVAIMVGTGKGAQNGILIKYAESLEMLHLVDTVVLDKTGTITEGKPKVTDIIGQENLLQIAGSLEKNSEHPLAEAILERLSKGNIEIIDVKDFNSITGKGVTGIIDRVRYYGGNLKYLEENNIDIQNYVEKSNELLKQGKTVLYFANNNEIIGIIAVADTMKDTSNQAIQELKKRNIEVAMITGDNKIVAEAIGKELGITKIISDVLPQDKEKEVAKLQKEGRKVAFVGDGINDSPALVKSDVGLAIGSGTDIAIESADIILMKNSLLDVVTATDLSKAVIRNIKMNLFWAFFYNSIGIPVAAGVLYNSLGIKLNPMIGAAAMSLSSVCVVTNALRLKKFKVKYNKGESKMNTKTISIEGMQCNHCKMNVEKALNSMEEVAKAEVNLNDKTATIYLVKEVDNSKLKSIIEDLGFVVKDIK